MQYKQINGLKFKPGVLPTLEGLSENQQDIFVFNKRYK